MPIIRRIEIMERPITIGFKCDCCEHSFLNHHGDYHEPVVIDHTFGYFSDNDNERLRATLCEKCYNGILKRNIKNLQIEG